MSSTLISAQKKIYLSQRVFNGRPLIDLRYFFTADDGDTLPTKKGVSLSPAEFRKVLQRGEAMMAESEGMSGTKRAHPGHDDDEDDDDDDDNNKENIPPSVTRSYSSGRKGSSGAARWKGKRAK